MSGDTFATRMLAFNKALVLSSSSLPSGIEVMNPFRGEHAELIERVTTEFYTKFFSDNVERQAIFGINPGRNGAGLTGTPFTDTKRLKDPCGIEVSEIASHELSSVFVYEVIEALGGPETFYKRFYFGNVCPLGFLKAGKSGRLLNYNYYDQRDLQDAVTPFIVQSIEQQIGLGTSRKQAFVMGKGKNFKYLSKLNQQHQWFEMLLPLDHPRYIMQYKTKLKQQYLEEYVQVLHS